MKMPPISKIYEAFSAIADNRIQIDQNIAKVTSSNNQKEYTVMWNQKEISSDDNATFWQKYPGYPIIAVWLETKAIPYQKEIVKYFKNINWHEINKKNKRDYDKSVNDILNKLAEEGIDTERIEQEVDRIYEKINNLSFEIVRKIKN